MSYANNTTSSNTLHIINKSPTDHQLYQRCFNALMAGDAILFIESAVLVCVDREFTAATTDNISYFLLEADIQARGLKQHSDHQFHVINDDGFVDLCCQYKKTISWF
ncbi:sulfurtransferase complex subunit TusB [Gammaproteobacteria bacterium AS21]|jgi:tRNA 2-thiouridine synthesizing protein B